MKIIWYGIWYSNNFFAFQKQFVTECTSTSRWKMKKGGSFSFNEKSLETKFWDRSLSFEFWPESKLESDSKKTESWVGKVFR